MSSLNLDYSDFPPIELIQKQLITVHPYFTNSQVNADKYSHKHAAVKKILHSRPAEQIFVRKKEGVFSIKKKSRPFKIKINCLKKTLHVTFVAFCET